jgi:murein DD-endopeptidase MepM/ murein hydrolase activator NlpD
MRMAQVRTLGVKTKVARSSFAWPVEPVAVTSVFGKRLHPITHVMGWHSGVDLGAYAGQRVGAAERGTVTVAGWSGGHGRNVEIHHPGGVITRYSHLSVVLVEPGATVEREDPIGLAGTTGTSTGVHVHFELLRSGKAVDPLDEMETPEEGDTTPAVHARASRREQ